MPVINPFDDVKVRPLPRQEGIAGFDDFRRIAAIEVGTGDIAFKADQSGIWLGGNKFADAPFSVNMAGQLAAKSATFTDGEDTTIIDATGLVSTASFTSGTVSITGDVTTTSTSFVDITGLSIELVLGRDSIVLFLMTLSGIAYDNEASDIAQARMVLDTTQIGKKMDISGDAHGMEYQARTVTTHHIATISAGTYTFKAQHKRSGGSGNSKIEGSAYPAVISYIVLGK